MEEKIGEKMKNLKLLAVLLCLLVFTSLSSAVKAEEIGVVDMAKVGENYTVAQEVAADLKVKEKELQEFALEAQKKIKSAQTPLEKKNLEEKLVTEFNIKKNAFAKEQAEKWQNIEDDVFRKIKKIAKDKKIDVVLNKQSVIVGGEDISEQVIKDLNSEAKKAKKK